MSVQPFGDVAHARAKLASATRNKVDKATLAELKRDLEVAKVQQAAEKIVAGWPPLTDAQRQRLGALFAGATS